MIPGLRFACPGTPGYLAGGAPCCWPVRKPGSVPDFSGGGHSSGAGACARRSCNLPGPLSLRKGCPALRPGRGPYSVLLPAGLAMPGPLPARRCALTAPFHPYLCSEAVCFLRRYPSRGKFPVAGRYPAPFPYGARTFLTPLRKGRGRDRRTSQHGYRSVLKGLCQALCPDLAPDPSAAVPV